MIFFLILMVLLVVFQIVELFLPGVVWMHGARIYLVPIVVCYGALALPLPSVLGLALLAGLLLDTFTVQVIGGKVEIAFGWSILLYGVLAGIVHGFRPLFLRGRWEIHCALSGLCTSAILLVQYLMISFRRGSLAISEEAWWQIGGPGIVAVLLAPLFYYLLHWIESAVTPDYAALEDPYR